MPASGTQTFLEFDGYEASLRRAQIELVLSCRADFNARLTWAELHHCQLLRCEEGLSRVGYVSFPTRLACISFPENSGPLPKWRGTELKPGEIMLHSLGEQLHQTTPGPSIWNLIILDPTELGRYSQAFGENPVYPPPEGRVLRPSRRNAARLRHLHAQAFRLAKTKPTILTHPEVARAVEDNLIQALIACLTGAKVNEYGAAKRHRALVMIRFEEILAEHLSRPLDMADLCKLVGVSRRTLQSCCDEFLGISAIRYALLRRLREVRRAPRGADPSVVDPTELTSRYGFSAPSRFAAAYRRAFGESPSATLRDPATSWLAQKIVPKTA